ncbi:tail fiber protein [Pectobacterium phage PPWS4]|uniref:Tail spike protein n=1 Tax=Pectobacterium phage PPWS4 TaxID=1961914 RepID=A0A250KAC7_9CAUD|nr:tail fiber protein [Pectobacterium phage PPWS4]BBA26460.1 tail spike protein [Pectobacterium phage PPWS4]
MANVIKTVVTYNLNGSRDFAVPFEYLARKFVKVTLIGQDRRELDITTDFRFSTKTTITTTRTWGAADGYSLIEIRRFTSVSDRLVDFQDGSILRANDLNVAQVQAIHIAEEARDLTVDTIGVDANGDLDARGRRIVNLLAGTSVLDAANVSQIEGGTSEGALAILKRNTGASLIGVESGENLQETVDKLTNKPITKKVVGGFERQNSAEGTKILVEGIANLAGWFSSLQSQSIAPTRPLKVVFSGDSTTAGDGTTAGHTLPELVRDAFYKISVGAAYGVQCINSGRSGKHTGQWSSLYVEEDKVQHPDLYIIRWGINDKGYLLDGSAAPPDAGQDYPNRRTAEVFISDMRDGIRKYRAENPFSASSILIMTPNSTYDIPNARDAMWYEEINPLIRMLAREEGCAFLDTYLLIQDSKNLAGILMDNPFGDGRGIHPNDIMNMIISGVILETIIPKGMILKNGSSLSNISGAAFLPNIAASPRVHNRGVMLTRGVLSEGYPIDGMLSTIRSQDEILLQLLSGYKPHDDGKIFFRMGRSATLSGNVEGWGEFKEVATCVEQTVVQPSTGFDYSSALPIKLSITSNILTSNSGFMDVVPPRDIPSGTIIGVSPINYRPTVEGLFGTLVVYSVTSGVGTYSQGIFRLNPNGNIEVLTDVTNASRLILILSGDIRN